MCLTDYFPLFARVSNYVEWIKTNKMIDKKLVKGLLIYTAPNMSRMPYHLYA